MFVELKCKTNFSFLRGASHPEELVVQAYQLGYQALGLNDENGVYGMPKAYWAAKQKVPKGSPPLKLIVGADLTLQNQPRLTLLARDRAAYGSLCRIITAAHQDKPKGEASLSLSQLAEFLSPSAAQGLIALPETGSDYEFFKETIPGRVYIPLIRTLDGWDAKRTREALARQDRFGFPLIATNDVHFHSPARQKLQDVLTSIRETVPLSKAGYRLFPNGERYLKSPAQMQKLFSDLPEALLNTVKIAESCTFCPSELRYRYPSEWIPQGHTAQSYLEELTWTGAQERYKGTLPDAVLDLIVHELKLIAKMQFADYFLTIYDIVKFARSQKILCQGRGSAANSVICYCLSITAVDPVRLNLLFERFISEERNEPPDIDVDFEHERREEVIQYIYKKYGRDRAAMVSAVVTYRKRSMIREIAKSLDVDVGVLSAKEIERNLDHLTKNSEIPQVRENILRLSGELEGFPRHLSIHSGGFTLSADPIIEIVPVEPARMEGRTIIQWDKYDLDYLGLLKIDVLSLGMLSALRKSLDLVGLQLHEIPAEDRKTYEMIQRADTVGTFQIESRAQMSMLGRLQPRSFYDLVIQVAIVRPGPIVGKMVHPYLRRRRGLEKVEFHHPKLRKILGKTLGVPLFQEQVMRMAIELAGFTPGEADELRRAIGAWRSSGSIQEMGSRLVRGLIHAGMPQGFAEQVFDQIKGFSQYGFPESHAASFALLAYASAYLKCHHPAEFTCSLVNSQPMGFYAHHTLLDDAKRHGVKILPLDADFSQWDCTLENGALRLGFRVVKGLAPATAEKIVAQKPYVSLEDFLIKNPLRRDILQRLALGDFFEKYGTDQRHALWSVLDYDFKNQQNLSSQQLSLFHKKSEDPESDLFSSLNLFESVTSDYSAYNFSARAHPMAALRTSAHLPPLTSLSIRSKAPGQRIKTAGLVIIKQRPPTAKGVTFATLEDEFGFIDTIIHQEVYKKYHDLLSSECFLILQGIVQRDGHSVSVLVKSASSVFCNIEKTLHIEPQQFYW
jgi:error-prone DNA polymerase